MHFRITIHFARRSLENSRFGTFGDSQHIDGTVHRCFRRLDRIKLIVNRRGGTSEIVNLIYLDIQRKCDIMPQQFESRILDQIQNIVLVPRKKVVDAKDFMTFIQ